MKKTIMISMILVTGLLAKANIDNSEFKANLKEIAGEKGPFAQNEVFPKDYFLISKNLPFLVGLTLHHPMSSTLELSKEQIEKIQKIKSATMPTVIKSAKEIKALELGLQKLIEKNTKLSELESAIDTIGTLKIALTKEHLKCIKSVREVLTKEQIKKVFSYTTKKEDRQ